MSISCRQCNGLICTKFFCLLLIWLWSLGAEFFFFSFFSFSLFPEQRWYPRFPCIISDQPGCPGLALAYITLLCVSLLSHSISTYRYYIHIHHTGISSMEMTLHVQRKHIYNQRNLTAMSSWAPGTQWWILLPGTCFMYYILLRCKLIVCTYLAPEYVQQQAASPSNVPAEVVTECSESGNCCPLHPTPRMPS